MPNQEPQPTPIAREPSPLEIAVGERSWDWLVELRRQLKVDLLVVDAGARPVLPVAVGDGVTGLAALVEQRDPDVCGAATNAVQSRQAQTVERAGAQIVSVPLSAEHHMSGALVISRAMTATSQSAALRGQLEVLGVWLGSAVQAHLLSPPTLAASGLDRIDPLARMLAQTAEAESDRELVRLFGEAIAVWHDIEMCGYVETAADTFTRDVILPGSERRERPASIPSDGLPSTTELVQLPQGHLDRFGLAANEDVYVRRFRRGAGRSWLLIFTGVIGPYDRQRLMAYAGLLDLALALSTAAFASPLTLALIRRLAAADGTPEERAGRALEEVRTALGAAWSTLLIESADGRLHVEAAREPGANRDRGEGGVRLVLVKRSEQDYTTTVSVGRSASLQFTPREREAFAAALEVFHACGLAALRPTRAAIERRSTPDALRDLLQRSAQEAISARVSVSVAVLLMRAAGAGPGSTQEWVASIRGRTRALDIVGMFAEGEIGVLLHDTTTEQARRVVERLRNVVAAESGETSMRIGVASRGPGADTADGLVAEARADALTDGPPTRGARTRRGGRG